jgi:hypothetical protein
VLDFRSRGTVQETDETEQKTVKSEKTVKTKSYNQMVLRSAAIPVVANLAYNPTIEALASKPGTSFLQPIVSATSPEFSRFATTPFVSVYCGQTEAISRSYGIPRSHGISLDIWLRGRT